MSDNNNGVNFVWVMDDKQKAMAGCITLVLLVVLGGWWGYNQIFRSDQDRLWDANWVKSDLENEMRSLDSDVPRAEHEVVSQGVTAGEPKALVEAGDAISWATSMLKQARGHLSTVETSARHLKRSSDPAMRAEGIGFADMAAKDHAKLDDYAQRLQAARDKLAKAVPREK
jgi:hypothetical protein